MRIMILLRDFLISIGFTFLGLFFFAKNWGNYGLVWGIVFLPAGTACFLKIMAFPFKEISPIDLFKTYFGKEVRNDFSCKDIENVLGRTFLLFIFTPLILFVPVGVLLQENFQFDGYFVGASALTLLGLVLGIKYFLLKVRNLTHN